MKTMMQNSLAFLALLVVALVPSTTQATCGVGVTTTFDLFSLICATENAATFSTLCTMLTETGIGDTLDKNIDYVVFAPTNTAFANAGIRAGVTDAQKQNTLNYHIYNAYMYFEIQTACGQFMSSKLTFNGEVQTSEVICTGTTYLGQQGDVNLPLSTSAFPKIVGATNDQIDACNGQFIAIDSVMGFDESQYQWKKKCSFFDPDCGRVIIRRGAKGGKGGYVVVDVQETVNGVTVDNIFVRKDKSAKGAWWANSGRWSNLGRFQTNFVTLPANNQINNDNNGFYRSKGGKGAYNGFNSVRGGKGGWYQFRKRELGADDNQSSGYDYDYDYAAAARKAQLSEDS